MTLSSVFRELKELKLASVYWIDDENAVHTQLDTGKLEREVAQYLATANVDSLGTAIGRLQQSQQKLKEFLLAEKRLLTKSGSNTPGAVNRLEPVTQRLADYIDNQDDSREVLLALIDSLKPELNDTQKTKLEQVFAHGEQLLKKLSFSDWDTHGDRILDEHHENAPALVLLDLENTAEKSQSNGYSVLEKILKHERAAAFRFLVVTNTCTRDNELEKSLDLAKMMGSGSPPKRLFSPLFAMSKSRFNDAGDLREDFAGLLQRIRLATLNGDIAKQVQKIASHSVNSALDRLMQLSLHEFMYVVTRSSDLEGLSEVETIIRIVSSEFRRMLTEELHKEAPLRDSLCAMRPLASVARQKEIENSSSLAELREREVYWDADVLNKLLSPVANGDIFVKGTGTSEKYFVVLSNDCDLTMRSNGTRNSSYVVLAELYAEQRTNRDVSDGRVALPYAFDKRFDCVRLKNFESAPMDVLDLCWLNESGRCIWLLGENSDHPRGLLTSQTARLSTLSEAMRENENRTRLYGALHGSPYIASGTDDKFDFSMKRVGRLSASYGHALLAAFATVLSRPSHDHDYLKYRG